MSRPLIDKEELPDEIARLAGACGVDWLYRYYSRELIWSGQAKTGWVPPDIRPLDFNSGSI